jgi:hypothetical protein
VLFAGLTLLALISIASWVAWRVGEGRTTRPGHAVTTGQVLYRCPMHPNYTSDKPGDCPICGMTLERVETGDAHAHGDSDVPGLTGVQIPGRTHAAHRRATRARRTRWHRWRCAARGLHHARRDAPAAGAASGRRLGAVGRDGSHGPGGASRAADAVPVQPGARAERAGST